LVLFVSRQKEQERETFFQVKEQKKKRIKISGCPPCLQQAGLNRARQKEHITKNII